MAAEKTGVIKKIIVEVPEELHTRLKIAAIKKGVSIKEAITGLVEMFIEKVNNEKKKNKK